MLEASHLANADFSSFIGTSPYSSPTSSVVAFLALILMSLAVPFFLGTAHSLFGGDVSDIFDNLKATSILITVIAVILGTPIVLLSSSWSAFMGLAFMGLAFLQLTATSVIALWFISYRNRKKAKKKTV